MLWWKGKRWLLASYCTHPCGSLLSLLCPLACSGCVSEVHEHFHPKLLEEVIGDGVSCYFWDTDSNPEATPPLLKSKRYLFPNWKHDFIFFLYDLSDLWPARVAEDGFISELLLYERLREHGKHRTGMKMLGVGGSTRRLQEKERIFILRTYFYIKIRGTAQVVYPGYKPQSPGCPRVDYRGGGYSEKGLTSCITKNSLPCPSPSPINISSACQKVRVTPPSLRKLINCLLLLTISMLVESRSLTGTVD